MSQGGLFRSTVPAPPPLVDTLAAARARVEARLRPGMPAIACPCCRQLVKLYRRKLNAGMARALVNLYRLDRREPGAWWNFASFALPTGLDYSKLQHFGFIEPNPEEPTWRITPSGRAFVDEQIDAPRAFYQFNNGVHGFTDERTTIRRALGDKFDLEELLRC